MSEPSGYTFREKRLKLAAIAYWLHALCACYELVLLSLSQGAAQVVLMLSIFLYIPLALVAVVYGLASVPTAMLSLLLIGVLVEPPGDIIHPAYVLTCFLVVGIRIIVGGLRFFRQREGNDGQQVASRGSRPGNS